MSFLKSNLESLYLLLVLYQTSLVSHSSGSLGFVLLTCKQNIQYNTYIDSSSKPASFLQFSVFKCQLILMMCEQAGLILRSRSRSMTKALLLKDTDEGRWRKQSMQPSMGGKGEDSESDARGHEGNIKVNSWPTITPYNI